MSTNTDSPQKRFQLSIGLMIVIVSVVAVFAVVLMLQTVQGPVHGTYEGRFTDINVGDGSVLITFNNTTYVLMRLDSRSPVLNLEQYHVYRFGVDSQKVLISYEEVEPS